MDQNGLVEMKDFSFSLEPKRFRLDPDVFQAAPQLPLNIVGMIKNFRHITADSANVDETILQFFDAILLDDSATRFRERATSKTEPLPFTVLMPIINWLMEEYGLRPTEPSSDSSSTSPTEDGSTPSTAGASPEESTGPGSPSTVS